MSCNTTSNQCEGSCQGSCVGKTCGDDGCGNSCGDCASGYTCNAYFVCENTCVPSCDGKMCGPNGCGGFCPPHCPGGQACNDSGTECIVTCGNGLMEPGEQCDPDSMPWDGLPCAIYSMVGQGVVTCNSDCRADFDDCTCDNTGTCGLPGAGCMNCATLIVCTDKYVACQANSECNAWIECIASCDNSTCTELCTNVLSEYESAFDELRRCLYCSCQNDCAFPPVNCM